jgi:hypothetical protein
VHGKSKLTETEKGGTGEEQSQEHWSSFAWTPVGLFSKKSSWQAKQSIPHTNVTFYGDFMKMCEVNLPTLLFSVSPIEDEAERPTF